MMCNTFVSSVSVLLVMLGWAWWREYGFWKGLFQEKEKLYYTCFDSCWRRVLPNVVVLKH